MHLCREHHLAESTGRYRIEHDPGTERITWTTPAGHAWVSDPAPPAEPAPPGLLAPPASSDEPCPF